MITFVLSVCLCVFAVLARAHTEIGSRVSKSGKELQSFETLDDVHASRSRGLILPAISLPKIAPYHAEPVNDDDDRELLSPTNPPHIGPPHLPPHQSTGNDDDDDNGGGGGGSSSGSSGSGSSSGGSSSSSGGSGGSSSGSDSSSSGSGGSSSGSGGGSTDNENDDGGGGGNSNSGSGSGSEEPWWSISPEESKPFDSCPSENYGDVYTSYMIYKDSQGSGCSDTRQYYPLNEMQVSPYANDNEGQPSSGYAVEVYEYSPTVSIEKSAVIITTHAPTSIRNPNNTNTNTNMNNTDNSNSNSSSSLVWVWEAEVAFFLGNTTLNATQVLQVRIV